MEKQQLTKEEIEERIKVLEDWIKKPTFSEMISTAVTEVQLYKKLLSNIEESNIERIVNTVHTQVYQQLGILI